MDQQLVQTIELLGVSGISIGAVLFSLAKLLSALSTFVVARANATGIKAKADSDALAAKTKAETDVLAAKARADSDALATETAAKAELIRAEAHAREVEVDARAKAEAASLAERKVVTDFAVLGIVNAKRIDTLEERHDQDVLDIGGLKTTIVDLENTIRQQTLTINRLELEVATANKEIAKVNKQLELANQQLTAVLYGQTALSQTGHTAASDAVHADNKQQDADAAAGVQPTVPKEPTEQLPPGQTLQVTV